MYNLRKRETLELEIHTLSISFNRNDTICSLIVSMLRRRLWVAQFKNHKFYDRNKINT